MKTKAVDSGILHTNQPSHSRPWRLRHLAAAILLAGATTTAQAVTLGQARVSSYLNQPLDAEIELIGVEPGQHEDLRIRIANQAQFERLGISYSFFLADLEFDVVQSAGNWVVRVRSRRPVSEPFLDFPVQMSWPGGQMIRQYTLLLDPPNLVRPATVSRPAPAPATPRPTATAPRATSPSPAAGATYGPVQRGETLWPIAQTLRPRGITTQQMAMALLRANPQAFIDSNINRLRAGAVLTVPPLGEIEQMSAAEARRAFTEQTRQWQAPVATSPREVVVEPEPFPQPATQNDVVNVEPPANEPADEAPVVTDSDETEDDQLRIVTKEEAEEQGGDAAIQQQLLVTMEEIESNRLTTSAIETRLARLEDELSQMQSLVELKDEQIAALQAEIDAQSAETPVEPVVPADTGTATADDPTPSAAGTSAEADITEAAPVSVEAEPLPPQEAPRAPWHQQYLWLFWTLLGVIGAFALGLLFRRQSKSDSYVPMSDLPSPTPSPYAAPRKSAPEEMKQAERDFRDLSRGTTGAAAATIATGASAQVPEDAPLVPEPLERGAATDPRPATKSAGGGEPGISDDDLAGWIEELGSDFEELELPDLPKQDATAASHNPGRPSGAADDDVVDVPSLLSELDSELAPGDDEQAPGTSSIELDPLDDPESIDVDEQAPPPDDAPSGRDQEDDAFHMSLDLARAYLEIGDEDGARDMLRQALDGAHDPQQRQQIEALLKTIG
jgi:FimV-like protein